MGENEIDAIFEQINKLKKPASGSEITSANNANSALGDMLNGVSAEIQRVLDDNKLTQEDLCKITGMSQSNISKILNGKVAPRLDTLQKIAASTNTKLVVSFEKIGGDE
ncbi:helix-turn-helix domain-containing protein [Butyrivibrio sp. YAB3001]|uniref:helix-turn-helix domain-containing protein n=1 Tax=Butyrivibrio sp. YAB3001 TaxID=1520812 RepID=UPI0008F688D5|nr:helix-turn-helix transcriptional regulator [Butyrivibrio sp. YAB3001]SFC26437.1 Helix-turn-helix [Butyrivibrio sp. YAB3001]